MTSKLLLLAPLALAACSNSPIGGMLDTLGGSEPTAVAAPAPAIVPPTVFAPPQTLDPTPPPPPPAAAVTVEQFDTTSAEDRAEAVAAPAPATGERSLGVTQTTLGPPTDPGIWLKTPLVTELQRGRARYADNGRTIALELRPSGGADGSGSQISLAAMRLLDAPITEVVELEVLVGN